MKILITNSVLVLSLFMVVPEAPAATNQVKVVVAPDAVTVFENRARVHRRLEVEMQVGSKEVVFDGLPSSLDPASVRAKLLGVEGLVLGVRMKQEVHEQEVQQQVRQISRALEEIGDQLSGIDARLEELHRLEVLTTSLSVILEETVSDAGQGGILGAATVGQIIEAQQWIADRQLEQLLTRDRLISEKKTVLTRRSDLRADMAPLKLRKDRTTWSAIVLLQAQQPGSATVELAHDVPGARWVPVHEARLDESKATVAWTARAQVLQHSGEAWNDVKLTLSTARSSLGLTPPSLVPVRLEAVVVVARKSAEITTSMHGAPAESAGLDMGLAHDLSEDLGGTNLEGAELVSGSGPVRFEIRAPATIPSDGSVHSVTISQKSFAAELDFQSIPLMSPHVFRRAKLRNPAGAPLLAGPVSCFREGAYVGDGRVNRIAGGQSFSQHFGSEGRIRVRKEEIDDHSGFAGSFSKNLKLEKAFRITVESVLPDSVPFELVDRIPVSAVPGIEINLGDETTADPAVDEDGIVRWVMTLEASGKSEFILHWEATADPEYSALLEQLR
jgi:uncharacterized protein (TIGR02231 family)